MKILLYVIYYSLLFLLRKHTVFAVASLTNNQSETYSQKQCWFRWSWNTGNRHL